jgi:hypothetical protein
VYNSALVASFVTVVFIPLATLADMAILDSPVLSWATASVDYGGDGDEGEDAEDREKANEDSQENQHQREHNQNERQWFDVLGVTANATRKQIKVARDNLLRILHTDRFKHERDDVQALADKLLAEVNVAYEEALKHCKEDTIREETEEETERSLGLEDFSSYDIGSACPENTACPRFICWQTTRLWR